MPLITVTASNAADILAQYMPLASHTAVLEFSHSLDPEGTLEVTTFISRNAVHRRVFTSHSLSGRLKNMDDIIIVTKNLF